MRRASLLVLSALAICAAVEEAAAQTPVPVPNTPYVMVRRPRLYEPITGGTTLIQPGHTLGRLFHITMPFAFHYYDETYDEVTVSSYGVIILGGVDFVSIGNQQPGLNQIFDNLNNWIGP